MARCLRWGWNSPASEPDARAPRQHAPARCPPCPRSSVPRRHSWPHQQAARCSRRSGTGASGAAGFPSLLRSLFPASAAPGTSHRAARRCAADRSSGSTAPCRWVSDPHACLLGSLGTSLGLDVLLHPGAHTPPALLRVVVVVDAHAPSVAAVVRPVGAHGAADFDFDPLPLVHHVLVVEVHDLGGHCGRDAETPANQLRLAPILRAAHGAPHGLPPAAKGQRIVAIVVVPAAAHFPPPAWADMAASTSASASVAL